MIVLRRAIARVAAAGRHRAGGVRSPCRPRPSAQQSNDNAIEEFIVTATKRDATIQDMPFSINAQTEKDIQRSGAVTLEDLSRNVAGLTIQNLGPGQSQVSVRGVSAGQVVRDQPGVKEQVGVYLDESVISLSLFTPDIDLFDLNRVETLRGPQGTLFGSGSVGGTIRYITNQPKLGAHEGRVRGQFQRAVGGDASAAIVKGAVNLPLSDKVAMRAVGYLTEYGGFIDALGEGGKVKKNVNDGTRRGGRVSLLFQPTETISITPRVVYQEIRAGGFNRQESFNLFANPNTTTRPRSPWASASSTCCWTRSFADNTLLADLTASFGFDGLALTSVTSYINRDIAVNRDASALSGSVSVDLGFPDAAVTLPSTLVDTTDLEQFTQELRLARQRSPFQWVVGGVLFEGRPGLQPAPADPGLRRLYRRRAGRGDLGQRSQRLRANSPYNAYLPYDIKQKAVFGEAELQLGKLTVTAGGRYYDFEEERRSSPRAACSPTATTRPTRPRLTVSPPAIAAQLQGQPDPHLQRPGVQGLPAGRGQRPPEHSAVLGAGRGDLRRLPVV
jgi:iron complex outermembrane receptor protein